MATLNFNQYQAKVDLLLQNLPEEVAAINDGIALTTVPLITQRLINTGVDGSGKSLGKYSTNPLPTFFFTHRGTGSGADKKLQSLEKSKKKQEGKAYRGISYEEFRQANNLPTDHVTLSFTGETLADIGVVSTRIDGDLVITTIGARGDKTKAKYNAKGEKVGSESTEKILDYLGERYGDILALNDEEIGILEAAFDDDLQIILDKYLEQ